MNKKTALFIGAHNDDIEYSAGGLAYLLADLGLNVHILNVACKRRVYGKGSDAQRRRRLWNDEAFINRCLEQDLYAASVLGAKKTIIGKCDDSFYECNNENIYKIKAVVEDINPDISFINWPADNHPDHAEVSKAAFRALCYYASCEIHAFEAGPLQSMCYFYPDFFIDISCCIDKVKKSLLVFDQPTANGEGLAAEKEICAGYRGKISGYRYAEAYKILAFPPRHKGVELLLPVLLKDGFAWAGSGQYPWGSRYYHDFPMR